MQWGANPVRELRAGACLSLLAPLEAIDGAILIILLDDRCSMNPFLFIPFLEVFGRRLIGRAATK